MSACRASPGVKPITLFVNLNHPGRHPNAYKKKKIIKIGPAVQEEFSDIHTRTVEM